MLIGSIHIRRYRSLLSADLVDCAGLNVLIGKNNAGKSNVLAAIEAGLNHLASGQVGQFWEPRRRALDEFTSRDASDPIQIGFTMIAEMSFIQSLKEHLRSETVGLEHAIEQLPDANALAIIIAAIPFNQRLFGFVEQIDFGAIDSQRARLSTAARLFGATVEVAKELAEIAQEVERLRADATSLDRLGTEFPSKQFIFREREASSSSLRRMFGNTSLRREIEELLKSSSDQEQFDRGLAQLRSDYDTNIEAAQSRETGATMNSFSGAVRVPPPYVTWIVKKIGETRLLHFKETRQQIGAAEAAELLQLKTRRGGTERLGTLQRTVKSLLGVQVDAFEADTSPASSPRRADTAEMDIDDFLVDANGAGIREGIRIILDLELKTPDIALIEEPEIHLHPGLERVMHRYLAEKSRNIQTFIATHSTSFVDFSLSQNIFLVSRRDMISYIEKVLSEDEILRIPEEIGLLPSTVLMFDNLVFVEGPTDEAILRELALKKDIDIASSNTSFVQMGGATKFAHYAAEATLELLSKRQVRLLFVVDRDESDDAEVNKLVGKLGDRASLLYWHAARLRTIS